MFSNELYSFVTSADGSIINERVRVFSCVLYDGEPALTEGNKALVSFNFREGVSVGWRYFDWQRSSG